MARNAQPSGTAARNFLHDVRLGIFLIQEKRLVEFGLPVHWSPPYDPLVQARAGVLSSM